MDIVSSDAQSQNDQSETSERLPHRDDEFSEDVPIDFDSNDADDAYRMQPGRPNFR